MSDTPERVVPEEQDFDPDEFGPEDAARSLQEGIELFNSRAYHAAHEAFERCWLASEGSDADFYKGLIQAAICLHHLADGNAAGAAKLYRGHRRLLASFLPEHAGLRVDLALEALQAFLTPVLRTGNAAVDWAHAPRLTTAAESDERSVR